MDPDLLDKYNRGSRGVWVAQTPALSVIDWGRYAFDSDAELVKFFEMHGHQLVALEDISLYAAAEEESLDLPEYPQEGYIVDKGDYIMGRQYGISGDAGRSQCQRYAAIGHFIPAAVLSVFCQGGVSYTIYDLLCAGVSGNVSVGK